jgi:hypothetical protein
MMLFVQFMGAAFASEHPVALRVPVAPIGSGELIPVTVVPPAGVELLLDGCAPIELEQLVDDVWRPALGTACRGDERPVRVTRDLTISLPAPGPGTWRATAVWGSGCHGAMPLGFASCASLGAARSESFTVVER